MEKPFDLSLPFGYYRHPDNVRYTDTPPIGTVKVGPCCGVRAHLDAMSSCSCHAAS